MIHILLIEDDAQRRRTAAEALRALDYDVIPAAGPEEALAALAHSAVQLIVADILCGGCELTRELRDAGDTTPVIAILDKGGMQEKRRVFRSGADGYMTLPLDAEELQMRVRTLLWRCRIVDDAVLRFGSCTLHAHTLTLETPDGSIELRHMEFLLLEKLLSYPGRVFTRPQLMDELWGFDSDSSPRTVDTHIKLLRQKLRGVDDIRLQTVRGLGYRAAIPRRARAAGKN